MKRILFAVIALFGAMNSSASACGPYVDWSPEPSTTREIQIALCLDTSRSMDGLIDSARQALWSVVNELALAEPTPSLKVALLTFGSPEFPAEDGWVVINTKFTEDLDLISERLFALKTNGGTEYVGRVLGRAASDLKWSDSESDLRIVIVAGNESADQDPQLKFKDACKQLIENGIMVNSIFCGSATDQISDGWRNVAMLADGHFSTIDQDNGTFAIASPFDERLVELSTKLNTTYCAFGAQGDVAWTNQRTQDANAEGISVAVAAQRSASKATHLYCNSSWDLVDASTEEGFDIDSIKTEHLPESMQKMTSEQKLAHIEDLRTKRADIQAEIKELNEKRNAFVATERERLAGEDRSLDGALNKAIRAQANARGFEFPEARVASSTVEETDSATP